MEKEVQHSSSSEENGSSKRTFGLIRNTILLELIHGPRTINQIGINTNINWKTVESHLTYLLGKKYVHEIFSSKFVRIFAISEEGKGYLRQARKDIDQWEQTDVPGVSVQKPEVPK